MQSHLTVQLKKMCDAWLFVAAPLRFNGYGEAMNKKEAAFVVRDVLAECAGSILDHCVSVVQVRPVNPKTLIDYDHYEVRIRCMVDDDLRRCINVVVVKHNLSMRQEGNEIVLFCPQAIIGHGI